MSVILTGPSGRMPLLWSMHIYNWKYSTDHAEGTHTQTRSHSFKEPHKHALAKCSSSSKRKRIWQKKKQKKTAAPVCMSNNSFLFQSWRHLIGYCVVFEWEIFLLKLHGSVSYKTFIEAKWGFNVSKWTVYLLCAVHLTFYSNAAMRTSMSKHTILVFFSIYCTFKARPCALVFLIETLQHYAYSILQLTSITFTLWFFIIMTLSQWLCLLTGKMLPCLFYDHLQFQVYLSIMCNLSLLAL